MACRYHLNISAKNSIKISHASTSVYNSRLWPWDFLEGFGEASRRRGGQKGSCCLKMKTGNLRSHGGSFGIKEMCPCHVLVWYTFWGDGAAQGAGKAASIGDDLAPRQRG